MQSLNKHILATLSVFFGSMLGGALRFGLQMAAVAYAGVVILPIVTVLINMLASTSLGALIAIINRPNPPSTAANKSAVRRLFWGTGFCGGFSSFSLFTVDWLSLSANPLWALAYIVLSIGFALAGFSLIKRFRRLIPVK